MQETIQWEGQEFLSQGHGFCPGCGFAVVFRNLMKEMGEDTILVITAGCLGTNSGLYPASPIKVAAYNTPFASAAAAATGVRAALDALGNRHTQVIAIGGDGGTFDIGLQALSAAAERNENFIFLCYDNEAYMNTGVQRSSATPMGTWTTTTPQGDTKENPKKDLTSIVIAHRVPYVATASVAFPKDLMEKIRKAKEISGFRFLHLLSPCPPGWDFPAQLSVKMARLAVQARVFPLYEVFNGRRYVINLDPEPVPLKEYLQMQGRFRYLSEDQVRSMQEEVDANWEALKAMAARASLR